MQLENLKAGNITVPWLFENLHASISKDQARYVTEQFVMGFLLSSLEGGWDVSGELNQMFPDYEFTKMEDFLSKIWGGKP